MEVKNPLFPDDPTPATPATNATQQQKTSAQHQPNNSTTNAPTATGNNKTIKPNEKK